MPLATSLANIYFTLAGFYSAIFVFSFVQLIRSQLKNRHLSRRKIFHILICFNSVLRTIDFAFMTPFSNEQQIPTIIREIFRTMPGVLFFSIYMLLIFLWAEVYHSAYQEENFEASLVRKRITGLYVFFTLIIYCCQIIIYSFTLLHWSYDLIVEINGIFFAFCSIACAIAFTTYGTKLYHRYSHLKNESREKRAKMRQIGFVTIICTTCFLIRAIEVILGTMPETLGIIQSQLEYWEFVVFTYYFMAELIPIMVVLFIFRRTSSTGRHYTKIPSSDEVDSWKTKT